VSLSSPSPSSLLSCAVALAACGLGGTAVAGEQPCGSLHVHIELESRPDWEAEVPALRARLSTLESVDPCAEVTVRAETDGVSVNVTSGQRSATRLLHEPRELVRTVEALVVLPPSVARPASVTPAELPPPDAPSVRPPVETKSSMELGAGGALRSGGRPLIVGGGVTTFAELADEAWLFGVHARWEFTDGFVSAPAPSGFSMVSGAIGAAIGRRIASPALACDLLLGPTIVLESQETFTGDQLEGLDVSAFDARVNATVRASTPPTSRVRFYAAGDLELSPRRVVRPKRLDATLPALPAWTSGIALGLMWGTR